MEIFCSSREWFTESNALAKSMAMVAVLVAGLFWLNPVAIALETGSKAVVVECSGLKPCWVLFTVSETVR